MDSGESFHITHNKEALFDLHEGEGGKVLMENDTYRETKEAGKIRIKKPYGSNVILTTVEGI